MIAGRLRVSGIPSDSREFPGIPRNFMEFPGIPWIPGHSREFPGIPRNSREYPGNSREFRGIPWDSREFPGITKNPIEFPRNPLGIPWDFPGVAGSGDFREFSGIQSLGGLFPVHFRYSCRIPRKIIENHRKYLEHFVTEINFRVYW